MIKQKNKDKIEYGFYETSQREPVVSLLSDEWCIQCYGKDGLHFHFHSLLEIGICYAGAGNMYINGEYYPYEKGCITFIPANTIHDTISNKDSICSWKYLMINIENLFSSGIFQHLHTKENFLETLQKGCHILKQEEHSFIYETVHAIVDEYKNKHLLYTENCEALFYRLFLQIIRMESTESEMILSKSIAFNRLEKALKYVENHYSHPIRIGKLAQECGLSETYFRKLFVDIIHLSPLDYVNRVRVEMASHRMESEDVSMEILAQLVGFQTFGSFNKYFKRFIGMTPYQYKKQLQNRIGNINNYTISLSSIFDKKLK